MEAPDESLFLRLVSYSMETMNVCLHGFSGEDISQVMVWNNREVVQKIVFITNKGRSPSVAYERRC
jgi:hypothetical protein